MNIMTELAGRLERITYTSEATGYTVAKIKVTGQREPVNVVGNLVGIKPGELL